jgi:hypothetical protein
MENSSKLDELYERIGSITSQIKKLQKEKDSLNDEIDSIINDDSEQFSLEDECKSMVGKYFTYDCDSCIQKSKVYIKVTNDSKEYDDCGVDYIQMNWFQVVIDEYKDNHIEFYNMEQHLSEYDSHAEQYLSLFEPISKETFDSIIKSKIQDITSILNIE